MSNGNIMIIIPYPSSDMALGETRLLFESVDRDIGKYILDKIISAGNVGYDELYKSVSSDLYTIVHDKLVSLVDDGDMLYCELESLINDWEDSSAYMTKALVSHLSYTWRQMAPPPTIDISRLRVSWICHGEAVYYLLEPTA